MISMVCIRSHRKIRNNSSYRI